MSNSLTCTRVLSQEAIDAGHRCWCNVVPMLLVPRAGAIRDTAGMIKMVADRDTDEVLGVSMVGNSAGEVIHEAAMGLRFHAKIPDFIDLLHVYEFESAPNGRWQIPICFKSRPAIND
jgi:pyruvate/2-oxoglutarate dehydrogenase complex dihydrolipoamide dehydrogenase (E3) component